MVIVEKIEHVLKKIIDWAGFFSAAVMIILMFYVAVDAIMRNVGRSFVGSNELVVNILIVVVFMAIGWISSNNAQIKIDVFTFLPPMDHVTNLICFATYVYAGIAAIYQSILAAEMALASSFLSIPRAPFLMIAAVGLILGGLGCLTVELRFIIERHKYHQEKRENKNKEVTA